MKFWLDQQCEKRKDGIKSSFKRKSFNPLAPHITSVQYCGGCSVHWGITSVQWGDNISTVKGIQYSGGYLQYSGG